MPYASLQRRICAALAGWRSKLLAVSQASDSRKPATAASAVVKPTRGSDGCRDARAVHDLERRHIALFRQFRLLHALRQRLDQVRVEAIWRVISASRICACGSDSTSASRAAVAWFSASRRACRLACFDVQRGQVRRDALSAAAKLALHLRFRLAPAPASSRSCASR